MHAPSWERESLHGLSAMLAGVAKPPSSFESAARIRRDSSSIESQVPIDSSELSPIWTCLWRVRRRCIGRRGYSVCRTGPGKSKLLTLYAQHQGRPYLSSDRRQRKHSATTSACTGHLVEAREAAGCPNAMGHPWADHGSTWAVPLKRQRK